MFNALLLLMLAQGVPHGIPAPGCAYCWPAPDAAHPACCPSTEMPVGNTVVWFTVIGDQPLTGPLSGASHMSECRGRLSNAGLIRYTVNGTAPSATSGGQLFPLRDAPFPLNGSYTYGPDGTAEGETLLLWDMKQIRGFKAIAATTQATSIYWTCAV